MVENIRSNDGGSPEGERRKTTVIREGPPRPEVRAAMGEEGRAPYQKIEAALARGSFVEGLAGTGAGVLMVLAILGTNALTLTAVGVIVLGGALFIGGGGIAAVAGQVSGRWRAGPVAVGGAALKALGGASAVAGGILVLANVVPMTLLPVSIIILGTCYLLESGGLEFLLSTPGQASGRITGAAAAGAGAIEILVGLAAVAIGALALAGLSPLILCSVAVLASGAGLLAKCMVFASCMATS